MSSVGAFEAKTKLAELLDRVESGETITITRHGKAVAKLIPASADEAERARKRALVEEITRWRVGKDRGAGPGTSIAELIKAGRRH